MLASNGEIIEAPGEIIQSPSFQRRQKRLRTIRALRLDRDVDNLEAQCNALMPCWGLIRELVNPNYFAVMLRLE